MMKNEILSNDAIDEVQANWQARYLSCPYGKASKYKYYAKRVTKRIKLAKRICKYTISVDRKSVV